MGNNLNDAKRIIALEQEIAELRTKVSRLEKENEQLQSEKLHTLMKLGNTMNAFYTQQIAINDLQADLADAVVNGVRV